MKAVEIELLMRGNAKQGLQSVASEAERLNAVLKKLGISLGTLFTVDKLKDFAGKVVKVRSEFQSLQASFRTLVGDAGKADELFGQIKDFAVSTPMMMGDLANGAQTMLGFNIPLEQVMENLRALGDISMGDRERFNSLTLAFSQMTATGKLMGQDLLQMINAGFNPLAQISEKTGKSISVLKDEMSAGAISADMVRQAFIDATSAGGKFNGMLEAQSKTLKGQISNLKGALEDMMNAIGERSEGVISEAIGVASDLVKNYEKVGEVMAGLILVYGSYKSAVILVTTAEKLQAVARLASIKHTTTLGLVTDVLTKKTALLNATMLANPYVLATTALLGLTAAIVVYTVKTAAANVEAERVNKLLNDQKEATENAKNAISDNLAVIRDETSANVDKYNALLALKAELPEVFDKYDTWRQLAENLAAAERDAAAAIREKNAALGVKNYDDNALRIKELRQLRDAFKKSPNPSNLSTEDLKLYAKYQKEMRDFGGPLGTNVGALDSMIRESVKSQNTVFAKEKRNVNASNYDDALLKMDVEQIEAQQKKYRTFLEKFASENKKYIKYEGVETPVDEIKRRIKANDARIKELTSPKKPTGGGNKKEDKKPTGGGRNEGREREQAAEQAAEQLANITRANEEEQTALMEDGSAKRLKLIEDEYEKRKEAIVKQATALSDQNKKAGTTDGSLTAEQQKAIDEAHALNERKRQKALAEELREQAEAKREYLKEWGTYEQQRLAITEEYAEKIRQAQQAGEGWRVPGLTKQRDAALSKVEQQRMTMDIDWNALYGGIDQLSKEMLGPMLEQLEAYVKGDEYRNAGAENQQKITDLLNQLRTYVQSDHATTWKDLATATQDFTSAVATYNDLAAKEREAYVNLNTAKTKLGKGEITKEDYDAIAAVAEGLSAETLSARDEMQRLGETLNATSEKVKNYVSPLTTALQNAGAWKGVDGFADLQNSVGQVDELKGTLDAALGSMGDGMAKTIGGGLSSAIGSGLSSIGGGISSFLSSSVGSIIGIVAQVPKLILSLVDGVKNFVTGVLNSVSELLSFSWLDDLVNSILEAIGNLIDTIFHIPENLVKAIGSILVGVKDLIGSILNTVTFGGFNSWIDTSNAKEVAETTERLTASNERLNNSVNNLKDELSNTSGWKAIDTAKQAQEDQQTINAQTLEILKTQMGYHGSHHSNAYYWDLSESDYAAMNQTLANYAAKYGKEAKTANSLVDIYTLSPEEMDYIRTYNVDLWKKMLDQGKYDKSEYWENYADLAGKMEEISESLKESLTQTSFDSMRSSFIDDLMDMDKSAQDFADNFQEYMMRSILNAKISDLLGNELQEFYDKWAEYAESDNAMTQAEEDELKRMWDALTEKGLAIRDQVSQFTGYTGEDSGTSQTGKSGGFTALSQDQGTKLEGMFTSDIMHLSSIDNKLTDMATQMNVAESYLARVAANSDYLKRLDEIAEDLVAMKRDGVKMK